MPVTTITGAAEAIADLHRWIAAANTGRDPEAATWAQIAKISEEVGEVVAAHLAVTGRNPRKGGGGSMAAVRRELLDVILTALVAYEHVDAVQGRSLDALFAHIAVVRERALGVPA